MIDETITISRNYQLWRMIDFSYRSLDSAIQKEFRKQKLSKEISNFLWTLYREHYKMNRDLMPADIARLSRRKPQTITAMMKRSLEKGYIYKITDESQPHSFRLALTEKGLKVCIKIIKNPIYDKIFAPLSEEDRRQLEVILPKLESRNRKKLEKLIDLKTAKHSSD